MVAFRRRHRAGPAERRRGGMALPLALFAIVVIGALVAAAFFAAMQEHRLGSNALAEQRAFAAAEGGVNGVLARWGRGGGGALNIPHQGDDTTYTATTGAGDRATVTLVRLTDSTLWVVSVGVAAPDDPHRRAVRRANLVVRVHGDTLRPVRQRSWAQLF